MPIRYPTLSFLVSLATVNAFDLGSPSTSPTDSAPTPPSPTPPSPTPPSPTPPSPAPPPPTPPPPAQCVTMKVVNGDFVCSNKQIFGDITGVEGNTLQINTCQDLQGFTVCEDPDKKVFESFFPTCSGTGTLSLESAAFTGFFANTKCNVAVSDYFFDENTTILCQNRSGCSRRRRLTASNQYQEHQDEEERVRAQCGRFEYHGAVFVTAHIYVMATPGPEAVAAGCPHAVAHAVFEPGQSMADKEIIVWPHKHAHDKDEMFPPEDGMEIGTFVLSELLDAVRTADPSRTEMMGYDIVQNNCAVFAINIAKELGLNIMSNKKVVSFVTRRLMSHATQQVMEHVRSTFTSFATGGMDNNDRQLRGAADDEKLLSLVIEESTAALTGSF